MLMYHHLNFITTYSNFVKTSDGHTHFPHITYSYLCNGIIQYNNLIGERSEPLSRVFNDPTCSISVRTYISNTHAHVRMSVCY